MARRGGGWLSLALVAAALALLTIFMPALGPLFARAFPEVEPPVYGFASFPLLLLSHAEIVAAACTASFAAALMLGIFVTRTTGRPFRTIAGSIATIGQTF